MSNTKRNEIMISVEILVYLFKGKIIPIQQLKKNSKRNSPKSQYISGSESSSPKITNIKAVRTTHNIKAGII